MRSKRGFTLVELMVAMAIAGILISLIFAVYTRMSVAYQGQGQITDINQNLRAAQSHMVNHLRLAGTGLPSTDLWAEDDPNNSTLYKPNPNSAAYNTGGGPDDMPLIFHGARYNGLKISDNMTYPGQGPGHPIRSLYVTDGGGFEPDEITINYVDHSKVLGLESMAINAGTSVVAIWSDGQTSDFVVDELLVLVNPILIETQVDLDGSGLIEPDEIYDRTEYESCLLQVSGIKPGFRELTFKFAGAYNVINDNTAGPHPCQAVFDQYTADITRPISRTDLYVARFASRAWRISPADRAVGILQSRREARPGDGKPVGTLFADWTDLGIGFTNMQIATQWYEPRDTTDDDDTAPDVDPADDTELEWRSGANQETPRVWDDLDPIVAVPVRVSLTLEARSFDSVDGVPTTTLPIVGIAGAMDTNNLGNLPPIVWPTDTAGDPRYDGDYIFRRSTVQVELRASGAGRF